MKNVFVLWLPIAAIVALTAIALFDRRFNRSKKLSSGDVVSHNTTSTAVSTATNFKVIDGDTILVTFGADIPVSIRLADLDAPELGQHFGFEAKANLEELLSLHQAQLTFEENDKYGRKVCTLLLNGLNLNNQLVENGFAWASPDSSIAFGNAQKKAKEERVGLWSHNNPLPPWEWRKNK